MYGQSAEHATLHFLVLHSPSCQTMSLLTAISVKEGEAALEKLPAQVEKMQTLLDSKFAYSTLSEVER